MTDTNNTPLRNLDVTVGYTYDTQWYEGMTADQFKASRDKLKEQLASLNPVDTSTAPTADEDDTTGDSSQTPLPALDHVHQERAQAVSQALELLNQRRALEGDTPLSADSRTAKQVCLRQQKPPYLHVNELRCSLRSAPNEDGSLGDIKVGVIDNPDHANATIEVPIDMIIRWDCIG